MDSRLVQPHYIHLGSQSGDTGEKGHILITTSSAGYPTSLVIYAGERNSAYVQIHKFII